MLRKAIYGFYRICGVYGWGVCLLQPVCELFASCGSLFSSGSPLTLPLLCFFVGDSTAPNTVMSSAPRGPSRSTAWSAGAVTRTLTSTSTAPAPATSPALVTAPRPAAAPTRSTLTSSVRPSVMFRGRRALQCTFVLSCLPFFFFFFTRELLAVVYICFYVFTTIFSVGG